MTYKILDALSEIEKYTETAGNSLGENINEVYDAVGFDPLHFYNFDLNKKIDSKQINPGIKIEKYEINDQKEYLDSLKDYWKKEIIKYATKNNKNKIFAGGLRYLFNKNPEYNFDDFISYNKEEPKNMINKFLDKIKKYKEKKLETKAIKELYGTDIRKLNLPGLLTYPINEEKVEEKKKTIIENRKIRNKKMTTAIALGLIGAGIAAGIGIHYNHQEQTQNDQQFNETYITLEEIAKNSTETQRYFCSNRDKYDLAYKIDFENNIRDPKNNSYFINELYIGRDNSKDIFISDLFFTKSIFEVTPIEKLKLGLKLGGINYSTDKKRSGRDIQIMDYNKKFGGSGFGTNYPTPDVWIPIEEFKANKEKISNILCESFRWNKEDIKNLKEKYPQSYETEWNNLIYSILNKTKVDSAINNLLYHDKYLNIGDTPPKCKIVNSLDAFSNEYIPDNKISKVLLDHSHNIIEQKNPEEFDRFAKELIKKEGYIIEDLNKKTTPEILKVLINLTENNLEYDQNHSIKRFGSDQIPIEYYPDGEHFKSGTGTCIDYAISFAKLKNILEDDIPKLKNIIIVPIRSDPMTHAWNLIEQYNPKEDILYIYPVDLTYDDADGTPLNSENNNTVTDLSAVDKYHYLTKVCETK